MDRLYRFTSATNRVNHGIVVALVANGANVIFDTFAVNDKVTLPTRFAYVSFEPNPFVNKTTAKSEVLPMVDVAWGDPWLAGLAKLVTAGKFDEWWTANEERERPRLLSRYHE